MSALEKDLAAIQLLAEYKEAITAGDKTNREGHAAKVYFNALYGKQFVRMTQQETDIINAGMNYGYTILRAQMSRIVVGYGLLTILGLFHKNEYNQFNLVDDLIEPFRPIIDYWVYLNLQEERYLTYDSRLKLVDLLNAKIKYGQEICTVTVAMDKYVKAFIKYIEKDEGDKFYCPIVSTLIWE